VGVGDGIFILPSFEFHHGNARTLDEAVDRGDEAVVHRLEEGRRRNGVAKMIPQEVAEPAGRLQLGSVGVQIQAIDAADFERHVLTDNGGDVGRHWNLLAEIPAMVLLKKDAGLITGPNIISEASPQTAWHHVFTPTPRRFEAKLH
jgi:hypothetical protein